MRFLTLEQVLQLQRLLLAQSGGASGIRNQSALESALAQPNMTFDGQDLYPTLLEKVAALGFTLIANHPFVDGNKRIGHVVMEVTLLLNGYEIQAEVDDQEQLILGLAAGKLTREPLVDWLRDHVIPLSRAPQ